MRVLEIRNVQSQEIPLYYRADCAALAVVELPSGTVDVPFRWTAEVSASGEKSRAIALDGHVDYPILPIVRAIRRKIAEMDGGGRLL